MTIKVEKLTDETLMQRACAFTSGKESKMTLERIYRCEHSPMRTQLFWIEMIDIPSFVSVHFARHNVGVTHFVRSNRSDITGVDDAEVTRLTPVNHAMLINAQSLVNMARKRLCKKSSKETRDVMVEIFEKTIKVDFDLGLNLRTECQYRNGCYEDKSCGFMKKGE